MTWLSAPGVVCGTPPPPREDAAWTFDKKSAKLYCFGGWANDWLEDLYTLDVSGIVGPPYAVQSLEPNEGPMTGRTTVIIHGLDFTKAGKITVKFTDGRNEETSEKAEFISPTQIRCLSPDWSKYSPGEVDCRVSIGGEGFTVNRIKWTYYVNTKPQKCVAYGPGIFDKGGLWGFPAIFKVQAKDVSGRNRTSGGDTEFWRIKAVDENGEDLPAKVFDNNDGTYDISYIPKCQGYVDVSVAYDDVVQGDVIPIRGSPWRASFENPWSKCKMQGTAPKAQPGMITSTLMKRIVFYGGGPGVHVLDSDNLKWETPEVEGTPPSDRIDHSLTTLDNEKMLVYGGRKPLPPLEEGEELPEGLPQAEYQDVHVLVCEKGTWKWSAEPEILGGDKPTVRAKHGTCLIPVGKKVVIFGGTNAGGQLHDDVSVLAAQNITKMDYVTVPKGKVDVDEAEPAAEGEAEAEPAPAEPEAAPAAPADGAGAEGPPPPPPTVAPTHIPTVHSLC